MRTEGALSERGPQIAAWPLRRVSLDALQRYLYKRQPSVIELSKDLVDGEISIKGLRRCLEEYVINAPDTIISFAGTTDLTDCSGFSFTDYCAYLAIQAAQARFLKASYFRFFVGKATGLDDDVVIERLHQFAALLYPVMPLIELHMGWESTPARIARLVEQTSCNFVVDFENQLTSGLETADVIALIPPARVTYCHARNLQPDYVEHPPSLTAEAVWRAARPDTVVLWEPKHITPDAVLRMAHVD